MLAALRSFALRAFCLAFVAAAAVATAAAQAPSSNASLTATLAANVAALNARVESAASAGVSPSATLRTLLTARRDLVAQMLRTDPAQARTLALSPATHDALVAADRTLAPLLESNLALTGELAPIAADDFEHGTATTLYTLHTFTADIELSFAAAPVNASALAHQQVTVVGFGLPELVAVDALRAASPAECASVSQPKAAATAAPSGVAGSPAPASCSSLGQQRVAILILKFSAAGAPAYPTGLDQASYWNTAYFGGNPSVAGFYNEGSQSQVSITGDTYGPFTLSTTYDCNSTSAMQTAAIAAAASTVDFSQYNRIVLVYPVNSCSFGGLGNIGCVAGTASIAHQYSVVWLPVSGTGATYPYTTTYPAIWSGASHELGHNLGLNHGNTMDFGTIALGPIDYGTTNPGTVVGGGTVTGTGTNLNAVNTEYGDYFSIMGYPWSPAGPYPVVQRNRILGWIPNSDVPDITTSGTYTLVPAENTSGRRGLHILRDANSSSWLSLEFNQNTNVYTGYMLAAAHANTLTSGAHIFYDDGFLDNLHTYMLDFTPTAVSNNFYDGNLAPGKSWSDPYSLLTISVGTQTTTSLPITVSYDTPCATVALASKTLPATGGASSVTITAPSTCAWTVSSNASWITFSGSVSGTGNGTVAFTAAANSTALQRNTYITAQRQSLPLIQSGGGITLTGLTPHGGSSVAGSQQPFVLSYSDGAGLSDLTQINTSFSGAPSCLVATVFNGTTAFAYLYDYSASGFTSTYLTLNASGGSGTVTTSGCTLTGAGSSYVPNGTSAALTYNITFTTAMLGTHSMSAYAYGTSGNTASIPFGYWMVTSAAASTPTTTTLTPPPPLAINVGQSVTLYAAVTPAAATGSVTFKDGTSTLGTGTLAAGAASYVASGLSVGSHSITAVYSGDSTYLTSTSTAATITVSMATTTTSLTTSATNIAPSGSATLTATVVPSTATGTVTFKEGTTTLGTGTLAAGVATYATSGLSVGTHIITATYAGDGVNYSGSTSSSVSITVAQASSAITFQNSSGSILPSGSATFIVYVTPAAATGTVTFKDGGTTLGTSTLSGGSATYVASGLSLGTHTITASYGGDTSYLPSTTSGSVTIIVVKGTSATALTVPAAPLYVGNSVALSASVTSPSGTPTGTVTFADSGVTLGTGTLSGGTATYTATGLAAGSHTITATYAGSSDYNGSPSSAQGIAMSDFAVLVATPTITVTAGQTVTGLLTYSPASGGFPQAISITCTGAPAASTCTVTPSSLTPGAATVSATLTLTTTARSATALNRLSGTNGIALALLALVPGLAAWRRRRAFASVALALAVFAGLTLASGCGGGGTPAASKPAGTPAGPATLTITSTAAGAQPLTHTSTIAVTVN
jgi:hypothetical protein